MTSYRHLLGREVEVVAPDGVRYNCFVAGIDADKGISLVELGTSDVIFCLTDIAYNNGKSSHCKEWDEAFRVHSEAIETGRLDGIIGEKALNEPEKVCPFG